MREYSGMITNYHLDDTDFYTTVSIDEVMLFEPDYSLNPTYTPTDKKEACTVTISAQNNDLLISLVRTEDDVVDYIADKTVIYANTEKTIDLFKCDGIKVYGVVGQRIKFECLY